MRQAVARGERRAPRRSRAAGRRSRRASCGAAAGRRRAAAERRGRSPLGPALAFLRDLRGGMDAGANPSARSPARTAGLPRDVREGLEPPPPPAGDYHEDEWGFDEEFTESVFPLLELMYDRWWRVEAEGVAQRPRTRPRAARRQPRGDPAVGRDDDGRRDAARAPAAALSALPGAELGVRAALRRSPIRKVGGVAASPYNAMRLLEQEQLVAVFPEGVKGTSKDFKDRYRLQRFGRGGFVELALRTRSPIIPVAVVGSEEIYPKIGESWLAKLTGAPFVPVTPTFPLLGPLGAVPLPSKWRIEFCDPIDTASTGPTRPRTARSCSSSPSACATRSSKASTRTWSSAVGVRVACATPRACRRCARQAPARTRRPRPRARRA